MSSIGAGVAASVSAQSLAERQAVAAKNTREREAERVRRELKDKFSPSNARVEETGAVIAVEGDEQSPADTKDQERHSERQASKAADASAKLTDRTGLDIEA
ncbi:MAG: hypothetical protein AAGF47_09725 [Planctomycetota bacterium]